MSVGIEALATTRVPLTEPAGAQCPQRATVPGQIELSVVVPCLNERLTVGRCVCKAIDSLRAAGIAGEVSVADNGSTDGSQAIAEPEGARVLPVEAKGYGSALIGGIMAARGVSVVRADADDSYDFEHRQAGLATS